MKLVHLKYFLPFFTWLCLSETGYGQSKRDSVVVPASTKYLNSSILRTMFIGKNYRKEWITPVKIPVFDIRKEQGGLTITEAGGGRQTTNLRLKDSRGMEWVLRSVDKNVQNSMTPELRDTYLRTIMQDLISASHPYGALTVPTLAEAVGVTVAKPQLFLVPDDPALGEYRKIFANTMCFLEQREPTPDNSETKSTPATMEKVYEKVGHRLLQKEILRARLLDMLIGDWDRHGDQWRWGVRDSSGVKYYYPVPRDRDFAYFRSDGLFVKFAALTSLPYMWGFTRNQMALQKLNSKISYIDAQWLNELTAEDWRSAIRLFKSNITDEVIETAVKSLPAEIYALSGRSLASKLKSRRDGLMKQGMRYYRFLAANPFVIGTDGQDVISIVSEGKDISVTISRADEDNSNRIFYKRRFDKRHTSKIFIKTLGGNDHFKIDETASSPIKLQLEGGEGEDIYTVNGKIKSKIEDTDSPDKIVLAQK